MLYCDPSQLRSGGCKRGSVKLAAVVCPALPISILPHEIRLRCCPLSNWLALPNLSGIMSVTSCAPAALSLRAFWRRVANNCECLALLSARGETSSQRSSFAHEFNYILRSTSMWRKRRVLNLRLRASLLAFMDWHEFFDLILVNRSVLKGYQWYTKRFCDPKRPASSQET